MSGDVFTSALSVVDLVRGALKPLGHRVYLGEVEEARPALPWIVVSAPHTLSAPALCGQPAGVEGTVRITCAADSPRRVLELRADVARALWSLRSGRLSVAQAESSDVMDDPAVRLSGGGRPYYGVDAYRVRYVHHGA